MESAANTQREPAARAPAFGQCASVAGRVGVEHTNKNLRSAAATAAGVAGGALLFSGIQSLFGHGFGGLGGFGGTAFAAQPSITETVINNYGGDPAFAAAVGDFLRRERAAVEQERRALCTLSPFRQGGADDTES